MLAGASALGHSGRKKIDLLLKVSIVMCVCILPSAKDAPGDPLASMLTGYYNWCTVEHKPWDIILFAGVAVVVACLAQGPFASLIVLVSGALHAASSMTLVLTTMLFQSLVQPHVDLVVWNLPRSLFCDPVRIPDMTAGGVLMGFAYPFNLRELGNGAALWLGIEPYELFFYIFLPPLLLDAALKVDWYAFKKVRCSCLRVQSPIVPKKIYQ